jgi:glutamine amidotransferase
MKAPEDLEVVIIDYGMGNLFSIFHACGKTGIKAKITSDPEDIRKAKALILPGVGAFGNAMKKLDDTGLTAAILDFSDSGKPILGICLGMQLLMSESCEFGIHKGLGLIKGKVVRLECPLLKTPNVGWRPVNMKSEWEGTPLAGIKSGTDFYFVHSFYVEPDDESMVLSTTEHGDVRFCSGMRSKNIFATQFHPERSGLDGLKFFSGFAKMIKHGS